METLDLFDREDERTVSEYTAAVKSLLEKAIPPTWIVGEVSNLRRQSSGHLYFSLKDSGAQLPAVMFRGNAARLDFRLEEGMEVVAFGEISVYEPHGRYQLVVRAMRESGQGRLHREFELLKKRLAAEGLFEPTRKQALPLMPLSIAVVTSPTGAALRDFLQVLSRRGWHGRVRLFPCKVQGVGSAKEIANSIDLANKIGGFDLIVAMRGGGSIEDLWSFNEETVARSVASSHLPVISGVGHEIDYTLCDFAADVRSETPSAAAELISSLYLDTVIRLARAQERIEDLVNARGESARVALRSVSRALLARSPEALVETAFLRLDDVESRLNSSVQNAVRAQRDNVVEVRGQLERIDLVSMLHQYKLRTDRLASRMSIQAERVLGHVKSRFDEVKAKLSVIGPEATLQRGFAILETCDGALVTRSSSLREGDTVTARLKDGSIDLRVGKARKDDS